MNENTVKKLKILAAAAKYDASCSSSGVGRNSASRNIRLGSSGCDYDAGVFVPLAMGAAGQPVKSGLGTAVATGHSGSWGGVGNACNLGLCHSFSDDGRCISLLKVLFTNYCEYDCAYCINRKSNDVPRAAFSSSELAGLVIEFYRRNYIEGLFLSSGIVQNPDYTMERMIRALVILRRRYGFNGYIHMKSIPGCSPELVREAGFLADRMSVNIEIPSETNLKLLAPGKDHQSVYKPMYFISQGISESRADSEKHKNTPRFAPAGQSTQMIIGASNERDKDILKLSALLYSGPELKRVYYSAFIPVNSYDQRLPALPEAPLQREHRLYQADWLMRFYHFNYNEIVNDEYPNLEMELDPKTVWALRNPSYFPIDPNRAEYPLLLRVPGVGVSSARRIVLARRSHRLGAEHLSKLGVVMKRAKYFLQLGRPWTGGIDSAGPQAVRQALLSGAKTQNGQQFSLFA